MARGILTTLFFRVQVFPPPVRRPAARPAEYGSYADSRRTSQFTGGISLDNFRFISVLGRGHFGKVIVGSLFFHLVFYFAFVSFYQFFTMISTAGIDGSLLRTAGGPRSFSAGDK